LAHVNLVFQQKKKKELLPVRNELIKGLRILKNNEREEQSKTKRPTGSFKTEQNRTEE